MTLQLGGYEGEEVAIRDISLTRPKKSLQINN
jgi:hypothetical protein